MPSLFPGMDPYLEGDVWATFHVQFGAEIARQQAPKAPRYIARAERRFIVESLDDLSIEIDEVLPDIEIRRTEDRTPPEPRQAAVAAPLEIATVVPSRVSHIWIEIRDAKNRKLVTAIEILSPTNKFGYADYAPTQV